MESRVSDFEMVKNLRNARIHSVQLAREGALQPSLKVPTDSMEAQVYVVKLLDVCPSLGKVAGRRLLSEIGVSAFARVGDLTELQRSQILAAAGEAS